MIDEGARPLLHFIVRAILGYWFLFKFKLFTALRKLRNARCLAREGLAIDSYLEDLHLSAWTLFIRQFLIPIT